MNHSSVHLVPRITTQEANAAHVAALEAENARLRDQLTIAQIHRNGAQERAKILHYYYQRQLDANRRLRAGIEELRIAHGGGPDCATEYCGGACNCGADEHNARIDALLQDTSCTG